MDEVPGEINERLDAGTHFPCLEVPGAVAAVVDTFLAGL